jgi:hypothetical protein
MPTESQNSLTCYHFEGSPFPLVEKHSIIWTFQTRHVLKLS